MKKKEGGLDTLEQEEEEYERWVRPYTDKEKKKKKTKSVEEEWERMAAKWKKKKNLWMAGINQRREDVL